MEWVERCLVMLPTSYHAPPPTSSAQQQHKAGKQGKPGRHSKTSAFVTFECNRLDHGCRWFWFKLENNISQKVSKTSVRPSMPSWDSFPESWIMSAQRSLSTRENQQFYRALRDTETEDTEHSQEKSSYAGQESFPGRREWIIFSCFHQPLILVSCYDSHTLLTPTHMLPHHHSRQHLRISQDAAMHSLVCSFPRLDVWVIALRMGWILNRIQQTRAGSWILIPVHS